MKTITRIGVFDSGLGGLTVLNEICKWNPGLEIVYFGDTARVPYGSRTPETIRQYAEQDVRFLLSKRVEAIVIACGTVSATCLSQLQREFEIPIIGVIDPAAHAASLATHSGHIGVLGTKATIQSGAYAKKIQSENAALRVTGIACPLFVPLIENGLSPDDPIVQLTVERYLQPIQNTEMDTLILGCTHYPFLLDTIRAYLPQMQLIHIGTALAKELSKLLPLPQITKPSHVSYYVSDSDATFQQIANAYLDAIRAENVEKVNIECY